MREKKPLRGEKQTLFISLFNQINSRIDLMEEKEKLNFLFILLLFLCGFQPAEEKSLIVDVE